MWKNSVREEDEGSSYGSYQNSLPSTSTSTIPISAIDIESNLSANRRDEASTALFSKKVKISAGFIMGASSLFLITIGLLALNSHSITLGGAGEAQPSVSSSSSVSIVDTSVVYACKTTCDDPCSTYQVNSICCLNFSLILLYFYCSLRPVPSAVNMSIMVIIKRMLLRFLMETTVFVQSLYSTSPH